MQAGRLLASAATNSRRPFALGWREHRRHDDFMQRVTGIGGLFFRANDPTKLAQWYKEHLGIDPVPTDYGQQAWSQEAGSTAFAPFPRDTDYFGRADQQWMINFRVRDLDAMVQQLQASKIEVKVDPETYPNGRFARLHDPDGNPIELWEPKET
jgi:catechol 2,3-dioxygenase-like lactoylglutathione lyase family enzyme